jgi:hypothetical protein
MKNVLVQDRSRLASFAVRRTVRGRTENSNTFQKRRRRTRTFWCIWSGAVAVSDRRLKLPATTRRSGCGSFANLVPPNGPSERPLREHTTCHRLSCIRDCPAWITSRYILAFKLPWSVCATPNGWKTGKMTVESLVGTVSVGIPAPAASNVIRGNAGNGFLHGSR